MSFLKNFDWSAKSIAKLVALALGGLFVLAIVIALISFSVRTIIGGSPTPYAAQKADFAEAGFAPGARIGIPSPVPPPFSQGSDAEAYEVKTYSAFIETRKLKDTCQKVAGLKKRSDVIFESATESDTNCFYRFKVKKESTDEILKVISALNPKDLSENVQTIKGNIENIDEQLQILENKLKSIESTLENAQKQYDELTRLATQKQDVESLAKIIDSKLNLIERLSNQRIQVKEQIDRYQQNKADQLDRLNYSFFDVTIRENLIIDLESIGDSWKQALQDLVRTFNSVLQGVSVGLVIFLIRLAQAAVYFFVALFLLKYGWAATKRIWKGKQR